LRWAFRVGVVGPWSLRWWSARVDGGGGQVVVGIPDDAVVEMREVIGWPPVPVWRVW